MTIQFLSSRFCWVPWWQPETFKIAAIDMKPWSIFGEMSGSILEIVVNERHVKIGFLLKRSSSWSFQILFIFSPTWGNDPIWHVFVSGWVKQSVFRLGVIFPWTKPPDVGKNCWVVGGKSWGHQWLSSHIKQKSESTPGVLYTNLPINWFVSNSSLLQDTSS